MSRTSAAFLVTAVALAGLAFAPRLVAQETSVADTVGRRVVVVVTNLRSDRGRVMGGLYASPEGWLDEHDDDASLDCRASIRHGRARCVFHGVPAGSVAFAGMHDEDGDGALDRDALGLPAEGYGFSHDASGTLGPPSFGAAAFATTSQVVRIRYGI
jgi:uncharacterized protein (DUF2141 family)